MNEDFGEIKRKFRPVKVGENPKEELVVRDSKVKTESSGDANSWSLMVNFDFDNATLSSEEKAKLDEIAFKELK